MCDSSALLGDLDPAGAKTLDQRMALSIIRDLIQLYDPRLERPGAPLRLEPKTDNGHLANSGAPALFPYYKI
jgi:hypothetical protein